MTSDSAAKNSGVVAVTGANGFVGQHTIRTLIAQGNRVRAICRDSTGTSKIPNGIEARAVGAIGKNTQWDSALEGVRAVVHLAARVHVMRDDVSDPLAEYREVNVDGTAHLARAAAAAGARRFVFVSSIKVNGEETHEEPFSETSEPRPVDPYGVSKLEAERALMAIAEETGLEVVILRPPLIYGPGVGANFLHLFKVAARGLPLPLGSVDNRRSLLYVGNLADALARSVDSPAAVGETFLVSDGTAVSTATLVSEIGRAAGTKVRLLPVPTALLSAAGRLTGKTAAVQRLLGSLEIESSRIRSVLNWTPPYSMADGLRATAEWWQQVEER